MKTSNILTCYMCDAIATSYEHAPAKCIFPERKDLPSGIDYRKNLIKVPSCDRHNTQKSADDEYLLYILPASIGSNEAGINQFLTKVQRAILRKPALSNEITENPIEVIIHDIETGELFTSVGLRVNVARIQDACEKTARAIYFYHTGCKHLGAISIVWNFTLNFLDPSLNQRNEQLFKMADCILTGLPVYGDNPEIFIYKLAENEGITMIDMTFYGQNRVLAVMGSSQ